MVKGTMFIITSHYKQKIVHKPKYYLLKYLPSYLIKKFQYRGRYEQRNTVKPGLYESQGTAENIRITQTFNV